MTGMLDYMRRLAAWNATATIYGRSPEMWRIDCDGRAIRWSDYGDQSSEFGWHIDHVAPLAIGGIDAAHNTRARHWRGNTSAGGVLGGLLGALRDRR